MVREGGPSKFFDCSPIGRDVMTASVAKEALEGHCIYDGGYCKLHLTYSRHTDLNLKVHNERSRDYTIQDTGVPMMFQAPGLPTTSGWQVYPQPTSTYVGSDFGATGQATNPQGQMLTWNSSTSGGSFVSEPNLYPGQTIATAPVSHYPVSANTSSATAGSLQASQNSSPYGVMSNTRPASSPTTRPLYYSS